MTTARTFRIGVALEGAGWHPAAWTASDVEDPAAVFGLQYWLDQVRAAAQAGVDFVTVDEGLGLRTDTFGTGEDDDGHRVRGRLDPVVMAAALLAGTDIGEVVVAGNVTHTNPFQTARQLASLNSLWPTRLVWRPQVSADHRDADVVGGHPSPQLQPEDIYVPTRIARRLRCLFREAEEYVTTVRRLWHSYPMDALAGGDRFWAPERFTAVERPTVTIPAVPSRFSTQGPLTVPVEQAPHVAVLAHHALEPYRLAAAVADRVFITPTPAHPVGEIIETFRVVAALTPDATHTDIFADLAVVLAGTTDEARRRSDALDRIAGAQWTTDTGIFIGSAADLAALLRRWRDEHGLAGVRIRPALASVDGAAIGGEVVPRMTTPDED